MASIEQEGGRWEAPTTVRITPSVRCSWVGHGEDCVRFVWCATATVPMACCHRRAVFVMSACHDVLSAAKFCLAPATST